MKKKNYAIKFCFRKFHKKTRNEAKLDNHIDFSACLENPGHKSPIHLIPHARDRKTHG